jgi:alpha-tubulin suppressor-like RCC1 family protein
MNRIIGAFTLAGITALSGCTTLNPVDTSTLSREQFFAPRAVNATTFSGGLFHTLALTTTGGVLSWGSNEFAQLGNGSTVSSNLPVQVAGEGNAARLEGVVSVAAGGMGSFGRQSHSLALKTNGSLVSWGDNRFGQLGVSSFGANPKRPLRVVGARGIVAISAGGVHSLALKSDGTVLSWGGNSFGQLGRATPGACADNDSFSATPTPVNGLANIVAIAAGTTHSLALRADGTLWSWGAGGSGQLGNGTFTHCQLEPVIVQNNTHVQAIAAGGTHSLALRADGTLLSWGENRAGQLGIGSRDNEALPVVVPGVNDVVAIAAGTLHTVILETNGGLRAWGENESGQLGNGSSDNSDVPVRVRTRATGVRAIAAGGFHSLAVQGDGTLLGWGANHDGQLATGDNESQFQPTSALLNGVIIRTP